MARKILIENMSGLTVIDTISGERIFSKPRRDTWYDEKSLQDGRVTLVNTDPREADSFSVCKIEELIDDQDQALTADGFREFMQKNAGFNYGGGYGDDGFPLPGVEDLFRVERDENGDIILTDSIYDFGIPPKTLRVGTALSQSDTGQNLSYSTNYNGKRFLLVGYELSDSGMGLPIVKQSPGPSSFDLQPIDSVTETFDTPVSFDIVSQQDVIGVTYSLKIYAETDIRLQVVRPAATGGEDIVIVDELFEQASLSLDGTTFNLTPEVDFEIGVLYTLIFSSSEGSQIQIKGGTFGNTNQYGVGLAANVSNFIPYIRRDVGYEYTRQELALNNGTGGGPTTPYVLGSEDTSVYADGAAPQKDPNGIAGWHFKNSSNLSEKVNWYYINNFDINSDMVLGKLNGMYSIAKIYNEQEFYFQVYTKRKNDGSDHSWYRSRITYLTTGQFANYIGQTVLVYWGEEPNVQIDLPRIKMEVEGATTFGPQDSDEEIFLGSLSTSTNYPESSYSFTAQSLGYNYDGILSNFPLVKDFDDSYVSNKLVEMETYLNAVRQGKFFRGFVMDEASMLSLSNPVTYQYVGRVDTYSIWEYDGTIWYDTLIEISVQGISTVEDAVLSYSDTRYLELDGLDDFINLGSVDIDIMDYTKSWSIGIELDGSVDSVNDATYITLFKRGNNEVTLRKGGANWGFYVYSNGISVGQANTWIAPNADSKILIVGTGSRIKYYLDGVLKANVLINANVSNQDPSGDLEIGKGGVRGANWTGGINNIMLMMGTSSNLGKDQLSEYFSQSNVTNMSFYSSVYDFLTIGERPYPSVIGLKQIVSGALENSTESAVIVRDTPGDIGIPFPQAPGRYAFFDGTDNHVEFDNADTNILDFTKNWAVAMSLKSVSGVNDSQKTILFSRGKNEITLVKGGSNWGFYCYADGVSVGQANTWYAPNSDSTIVVICDGNKVQYFLNGIRRANVSLNANVSNQDPSGNLLLGKGYQGSVQNWYGGIENSFIMSGDTQIQLSHIYSPNYVFASGDFYSTSEYYYSSDAIKISFGITQISLNGSFVTIHFENTTAMNIFRSNGVDISISPTDSSTPNWAKTYSLDSASEYTVETYYSYVSYNLHLQAGSSSIWNDLVGFTTNNDVAIDFGTSTSEALLTTLEVNEFVMGVDPTSLSYYDKIDDFFELGSRVYPSIDGVKGSVTGDLIDAVEEDFINI